MEKLPILRTDFPEFDWETEGEIATAANKALAYTAATTQGQCADFHRTVWNEMVVTFAEALEEAGIEWNDAYETYTQTCVLIQYGALTAKKFNSFRLNLDSIAPTGWKWAFQKDIVGYVGRKDFYGVTERGSSADILYGWYLIEIARKLNLTLRIMKNTADFSELAALLQSNTLMKSDAVSLPSAPMDILYRSISRTDANAVALPSERLATEEIAKSKTKIEPEIVPTARMHCRVNAETSKKMFAEVLPSKVLFPQTENIRTLHQSAMAIPRSTNTEFFEIIHTKKKADMDVWKALYVNAGDISKTEKKADAVSLPAEYLISTEKAKSKISADAMAREAFYLEGKEKSKTKENVSLAVKEALQMDAGGSSASLCTAYAEALALKMISGKTKIKSESAVTIDSAWYPPELIEDGVYYIRQVYDYSFDEETGILEVI